MGLLNGELTIKEYNQMTDLDLFVNWNKALFNYFFPKDLKEDEEVSLYIDKDKINEIGKLNELGGYDEFMHLVMLPIDDRQKVYCDLRKKLYVETKMSEDQKQKYNSKNLFDFATIYIDNDFYKHLDCPFLVYIVYAILMASECIKEGSVQKGRKGSPKIGRYITEKLREHFRGHSEDRTSFKDMFNELANRRPQFIARQITKHPYIGLIKYQLGLNNAQVKQLEKAMFCADLSEDLPYDMWVCRIQDYVDKQMCNLLCRSNKDAVLRKRVSDLRFSFDPSFYELRHRGESFISKGHFVLAVYEDEYTVDADRLVLLTDVNNKTISNDKIKITKGTLDRLGEYAEYNVNHVLIGESDKAEMKSYSIRGGGDNVSSVSLGNIVIFSRYSSNYLIQTKYPQKGKETYILVKKEHEEEWNNWLISHGSPSYSPQTDEDRIIQIFGKGWQMYISDSIEYTDNENTSSSELTITMDGGIRRIGMNNVFLITALPYFEFSEPIIMDKLSVYINVDGIPQDDNNYNLKIVHDNKLIIDFINIEPRDRSLEIDITLEYKKGKGKPVRYHVDFKVIGQDVNYKDEDLFKINMWGNIASDDKSTYLEGFKLNNSNSEKVIPTNTGFYQNRKVSLNAHDRRFYLINLIAADCSMRKGFSITESRLKKCIRYAATRFDINIASNPSFYTDIKYLLINCGYINADFEQGKYQPTPPTFIKTPIGFDPQKNLFMLVGSYTQKFLVDLKEYCEGHIVSIYLHNIENENMIKEYLLPPVILLKSNFNPNDFIQKTDSKCMFLNNDDVAINILSSLPTYSNYEKTLDQTSAEVVGRLEYPTEDDFPRVRYSKTSGYGSSRWIEKRLNDFYRITQPDMAWANLYCRYKKQKTILSKDLSRLLFPVKMHLPVIMQRSLYLVNLGIPKKEKAFICYNDNNDKGYFNLIKRYDIKDDHDRTRTPIIVKAITGRTDNDQNPSRRNLTNSSRYHLYFWKNRTKHSKNPRSLLVLTYNAGNEYVRFPDIEYGLGFRKVRDNQEFFEVYLRNPKKATFRRVETDDVNHAFSKIITSGFVTSRLDNILANADSTYRVFGVKISESEMQLPPREEYEIEEITII